MTRRHAADVRLTVWCCVAATSSTAKRIAAFETGSADYYQSTHSSASLSSSSPIVSSAGASTSVPASNSTTTNSSIAKLSSNLSKIIMADDSFTSWNDNFVVLTKSIERKIEQIEQSDYDEQLAGEIEHDFDEAGQKIGEIQKESRHYEFSAAEKAKRKLKEHEATIRELRTRLNGTKPNNANAAAAASASGRSARSKRENVRGKLLEGKSVMDESGVMIDNMQGTIAETHAVGVATTQKLISQRGQIVNSIDTLKETDSILSRSRATLIRMRRRIVTNKLLTAFIILLELGICALIVYLKYYA